MRTKMKRKKRSGVSLALLFLIPLLPAPAAKKSKPESYSLVAGTVFRESGYALPQAEITLIPDPQPDSTPAKERRLEAYSDAMHYILKVAAKGFQPAQKPVVIQGEERVDVTFQLQPESK